MHYLTHPRQVLDLIHGPLVVVLGNFDGVHQGHQALLAQACQRGQVLVVTFNPHPVIFLKKATNFLIATPDQKAAALAAAGIDYLCTLDFTQIYQMPPANFIAEFLAALPAQTTLMVGENFHFGYQQEGTPRTLQEALPSFRVEIFPLQKFSLPTTAAAPSPILISSRQIRTLIKAGDLATATQLLGRPFALAGTIQHGQGLAKQLNFATANLPLAAPQLLPPFGVYQTNLIFNEQTYPGVSYVGVRPSVQISPTPLLETHLLTANLDLYEQAVQVDLLQAIRPEMKFKSLGELQQQVERDIQEAQKLHHLL